MALKFLFNTHSSNGQSFLRQHTITQTNDNQYIWCHMASPRGQWVKVEFVTVRSLQAFIQHAFMVSSHSIKDLVPHRFKQWHMVGSLSNKPLFEPMRSYYNRILLQNDCTFVQVLENPIDHVDDRLTFVQITHWPLGDFNLILGR